MLLNAANHTYKETDLPVKSKRLGQRWQAYVTVIG